jgi:hypothetical protein
MSLQQTSAPRPLPALLKVAASVFALFHLGALAILAMEAQSGPWVAPPPIGVSMEMGPLFARTITERVTFPYYLKPLRMTHNYHFDSNRPELTSIAFEVVLKDHEGKTIGAPMKFPDPKANRWVRHRQTQIARTLGNDQPVLRLGPDKLRPVDPMSIDITLVDVWKMPDKEQPHILQLTSVPEHLAADQGEVKPSQVSKILLQSYVRHLCRKHGAKTATVVRIHRDAIAPAFWFTPEGQPNSMPPATAFRETKSHYGDYTGE